MDEAGGVRAAIWRQTDGPNNSPGVPQSVYVLANTFSSPVLGSSVVYGTVLANPKSMTRR